MKKFTLDDLILTYGKSKELNYFKGLNKRGIHIGQAKLFFSELLFLTDYFDKSDVVLYIGSSRGKHINLFPILFPGIQIFCYDPSDSDIDTSIKGLFEYRKCFDNEDIEYWKERSKYQKILLISDIRTFSPGNISKDEEQINIKSDLELQKKWVDEIQPFAFHLKFRLPYFYNKEDMIYEYLDGKVYIEPWNHPGSAENRLVGIRTSNGFLTKEWNTQKYENMCFYLNKEIRNPQFYTNDNSFLNVITKDERPYNKELLNDIDSTITMFTIYRYLKKYTNLSSNKNHVLEDAVRFFYWVMPKIAYKKTNIRKAIEINKIKNFKNKYVEHKKSFSYKGITYKTIIFYNQTIEKKYIDIENFDEEDRQNILINVKDELIHYIFLWYPIGKNINHGPGFLSELSNRKKNILLNYISVGDFTIKDPIIDQLDVAKFVNFDKNIIFFGRIYNLIRYLKFKLIDQSDEHKKIIIQFFINVKKILCD